MPTTLLSDKKIREYSLNCEQYGLKSPLISDFSVKVGVNEKGDKMPSRGVDPYGYTISLGNFFYATKESNFYAHDVFTDGIEANNGKIIIRPSEYLLLQSMETISLARNISAQGMGKSTYARRGLIINTTAIDAGWSGILTIPVYNASPADIHLFVGWGITQLWFWEQSGDDVCELAYGDTINNYQNTTQATVAAV